MSSRRWTSSRRRPWAARPPCCTSTPRTWMPSGHARWTRARRCCTRSRTSSGAIATDRSPTPSAIAGGLPRTCATSHPGRSPAPRQRRSAASLRLVGDAAVTLAYALVQPLECPRVGNRRLPENCQSDLYAVRRCGPPAGATPRRLAAARTGRSALAGQDDAAAFGLWVQHGPDGWVAAQVVDEALEHGQVGAADELAVVGGDAVEGAVTQPDGAVGVVEGL